MKRTRKRALSLTLSVMMTASLLPSYLTQLPIPARADDPPASDYTPDTDPTIDFDYANTHNIMNADDALRDLAAKGRSVTSTNKAEEMYRKFPWRHASGISCNAGTDTDDSVRALLESTDPNDKYVVLAKNATISQDYWKGHKWEPINITKDKVLDLSGRQIRVDYDANINHSDDQPSQEYRWKEAHYQTMFEIEDGATLTIIDSNEWRASGSNGMISFKADWCDHFSYDYKWYGHRDLFHVKNGNLIIYGGIYDAGLTKVQTKEVSNFTWEKLQTAIGTAVELGVNIAKYATGISTADAAYKDVLKDVADMESGKANPSEPKPGEAQKSQPDGKTSGRNQSVSEKAASKDAQIAAGNKTGTPEGENKTDSDGKAKNDSNTKVANAKNEIVNQVIDKDDISGMVQSGFSLVNQIVDMCGTTSYPPISNTIMGTAVRVGKAGTFASYGGKYYGYGSTPDTRNAVVEVLVNPLTAWPHDHSKRNGGRAYIYDGDFYAGGGANVFNICRDKGDEEFTSVHYRGNTATKQLVPITYDEHYGVEELFYSNQDALDKGTLKDDGKIYDANGKEIVPQPITTANIQVRGGTFHCHYDVMNMAKLEAGSPELDEDYTSEPHFRKFPGTSGAVNLGVDSFGADLIRDGRIQIEDNSDGCLVLMDDQEEGYNGLYHYRLFCGDNELRTKAYLRVTPNNDAQTNSSYSMQLATYYGAGTRTNDLFKDDANGDNIRSPYRQMESYFDFQIDDTNHRSAYSVKPNFRVRQTDENDPKVLNKNEWDVYGENVASSEVWYYPAPLDKNGHQIGDVDYGYSQLTMFASESGLKKVVGTSQYNLTSKSGGAYHLYDRNLLDDDNWSDIISSASSLVVTSMNKVTYKTVRTTMKYFTYKVYQVDPLTRENLNANGWSHTMEICDPNSPEGYLTIKTDENEEFGEDVPATFSIEKLRDFYDGSKISSVTYVAYGKYKTFTFSRDKVETNIAALPPVRYPKDFTDMTEHEPGLWTDFYEDYHDYDGAFVAIGLTEDIILEQVRGDYYVPDMDVKYAVLKPAPKIGGWFTITPGKDYDPNKLDEEQSATFSITSLNGLNAGETISGVTYYAFGKQKVFSDLSIYDLKDLPNARYPVGFTNASHLNKVIAKDKGDVWVKVTTSKGSEHFRTVYFNEQYPILKGTAQITYDEDMSYATYDHPAKLSLENFTGLAYNEEVTAICYQLVGSTSSVTFTKADNPELFADGLPSATYPDDFLSKNSLDHGYAKKATFGATVTIERKSLKQETTENSQTGKDKSYILQSAHAKKPVKVTSADSPIREYTFYPENFEEFRYVVKAEKIERCGNETEEIKLSDIQSGKYDNGIDAFHVWPGNATIGYDFGDCTVTNDKVASLVTDPNFSYRTKIKLTGEPGEATFSMQSPDGTTVTKTVRVVNDYDSVDISGIQAPVIGEKFDTESIKVPENAPYRIKEIKWYKGSRLNEEVGADAVAEYFNSYTVGVTVEPKEYSEPASDVSYQLRVTKPDGTVDIVSPDWVEQAFDYENHLYLPSYTIQYTFPAQSDHAASVIDEIHIDFPTEVEEGTYWNDWVKNVHIYTNGYDEGFTFDIRQTFGPDAESIASALGYGLDTQKVTVFRFVKGIQNGIGAEIRIPDELKELGDVFADKITVYINGEESKTFGYYESGKVLIAASDTLKVTGNAAPEAMPGYTVKGANAVVGETININDLLVCDDPRVSIRIRDYQYLDNPDDYLTYDPDENTITPIQKYWDGFSMNYIVSFDADKDGKPEYERSSYLYFPKIYADDSEIPEGKKVTDCGTARVTLLNPDGTEAGKADYPIRAGKNIPEVKNAFLAGTFDSGNKAVDPYFFENGMRYTVKTVSADEFEVYAGADTVYGFIKNQDGNDISGIQISVDGEHFYAGDHITGLIPDTDYTLYYRQNADGTLYAKNFHTAKQDYGVYIGRRPVTDENLGDLEQDGWTYDPDKKVLTLKNFSIKDKGAVAKVMEYAGAAYSINAVISAQDELTVRLIGDNEIENLGDSTSSAVYAEKSLTIEGNGNLTVAKGGDVTADKGIIEYTNGSIEFIPKLVTANNVNYYPTGSLVSESHKDSIKFTSSVHDLTVDAGKTEEEIAEISESELADVITNPYLTITPQHHDVNKAASAESYESGTCDKGCLYHLSCDCGHISEETFTAEAEEHVLVKHEAKSATCDQAGAPAYWECTHCGECYADAEGTKPLAEADLVIPALGHKLTHHAAKDATCGAAGVIEYWECSTCGERFADETAKFLLHDADLIVPKTAHEWVQVFSKAATCDTDGVSEHWECKNCGKFSADSEGKELLKKEDLVTPAFGHSWSAWTVVKEATQTAEGEEVRVCDVCGETENRAIEKLPIVTTTTTITTTTTTATTTSTTKATTTTAKATTTTKKATTTTTKATTTTAKVTTTTAKATTTTTKATTTTTKATTTTTKTTTTTTKTTTTTTKTMTTTTKATTTTTKATTTTTKATTTTTKATTTTTKDVTAATTTTFTTESGMTIVTSVKYKIEIPDTKLNFCSNDSSSIMNCRGLKDLTASLTLYKFYVNKSNQFVDANGAVLSDSEGNPLLYTEGQPIAADETAAFDVQESDIAGQIAPEEQFSTAAKIWESERKAQFGDDYQSWDTNFDAAAKQDISTNHANKYNVKLYFDPSKSENPACRISEEPVEIGEIRVFIGVKGDFNLNNKVDLRDLQGTLKYYTWSTVSRLEPEELVGALSADPELDGEDGLIYYLLNVVYRDGKTADSPVSETQKIALADQRALLKYYTYRYVSKLDPQDYSWEKIVGYDLENQ